MLKEIRIYFITILFFLNNFSFAVAETEELKLSNKTVNSFYDYISSKRGPLDKFLVTLDGENSFVWVCPQTLCFPAGDRFYLKPCSKAHKNKECKILAMGRKIKTDKKDKVSKNLIKFTQDDTFEETKKKLKKLGFIN
jgi:hypothetical protein